MRSAIIELGGKTLGLTLDDFDTYIRPNLSYHGVHVNNALNMLNNFHGRGQILAGVHTTNDDVDLAGAVNQALVDTTDQLETVREHITRYGQLEEECYGSQFTRNTHQRDETGQHHTRRSGDFTLIAQYSERDAASNLFTLHATPYLFSTAEQAVNKLTRDIQGLANKKISDF